MDQGDGMTLPLAFLGSFGDAIDFIFRAREQKAGGAQVGGLSQFGSLTWDHMKLSLAAMGVACLISLPLGMWLGHKGRGGFLAINASNVGRAVPSFALIAFFAAYLGTGFTNVMLALVLLAIPPILTNAYVGIRQSDRDTVDSARGMGMTEGQIVRRVELPLAVPLIFGGIRTSMVNVVGTATIAPLAGVSSLGDPIINVTTYGDAARLAAAIVVALLAVTTEFVLAGVQRAVTPRGLKLEKGRAGLWGRLPLINRREATT
jgi:osmoprotectant transport system permease protein